MFGLGPATRIYLAVGSTDLRKGFEGLHGGSGAIPRKCMLLSTNGFLGFMSPRLRTKARERLLFFRSAV